MWAIRSTSTSGPASCWNRASSCAQAVGQDLATRAMAQLRSLTTKRPSPALVQSAM